MAQKYFNEVTNPSQYLRRLPDGSSPGFFEPPKTIDQALERKTDILDGNGAKTGVTQADYIVMLSSHTRRLMDTWKRVPTHEEALADMLLQAHPDWNENQLFALGCKDLNANQAKLKAALAAQQLPATPKPQAALSLRPLKQEPPVKEAAARPVKATTVVNASTGSTSFRFPVVDWTESSGVLVLVQEADSPYKWIPGDTAEVLGFAIGDNKMYTATWSGIEYTLNNLSHLILVLE